MFSAPLVRVPAVSALAAAVLLGASPVRAAPPPPRAVAFGPAPGPGSDGGEDAADATQAKARALFEEGAKAYALGRYAEAVEKFEASYDLYPAPELLFNLGQAYARWYDVDPDPAKLRKARALFRNYVSFVRARDYGDSQAASDALDEIEKIDEKLAAHSVEDASGPEEDRRRRRIALGVGIGLGSAALVAGAVVLGVLLARKRSEPGPELGTIPVRGPSGPTGPVLIRF